jgi:Fe-S cluster assembly protein SufD
VPKALEATEPVVLRLTGPGTGEVVWGHVVVDVAEQARVHGGRRARRQRPLRRVVSVLVGDGAALQLVQVQDWADDAVHGAHVASPARAATPGSCRRR